MQVDSTQSADSPGRIKAKRRWPWFLAGVLCAYPLFVLLLTLLELLLGLLGHETVETTQSLTVAKGYLYDYERTEGPANRGSSFARAAQMLGLAVLEGETLSQEDVLGYLGPPDLVCRTNGYTEMAYFYDRFGDKDWVAYVVLKQERVEDIGLGPADASDYSDWQSWSGPALKAPP
jgi:hypothetical protein